MSIKGQGHSLTLVKGHSDFKVKCLTFGLYNQVSDSGPEGPLVSVVTNTFIFFDVSNRGYFDKLGLYFFPKNLECTVCV